MSKRILIGKITGAHGIRGEVKVYCYADDAELLFRAEGLYTSENTRERVFLTFHSQPKGTLFVASVKHVNDRTAAEKIGGTPLYVERDELPELEEGSIYHFDLEGLEAYTEDGNKLGKVVRVQNYGAGDLLDIQKSDGKNVLIPYAAPHLVSIDMDARRVVVQEIEVL